MRSCLLLFISIISATCFSQEIIEVKNEDELMKELNSLMIPEYKMDSGQVFKVVLELKIDSLGEIHSCHVRWAKNLDCSKYYFISKAVESKYRVRFLFNEYKKHSASMDKYAYCQIPIYEN